MNKELIILAESKGFNHYILDNTFGYPPYGWYMYDLQKWLRKEHNIWITIIPEFRENHPYYTLEGKQIGRDKFNEFKNWFTIKIQSENHNKELWHTDYNYEQSLEQALQEALKLINDE